MNLESYKGFTMITGTISVVEKSVPSDTTAKAEPTDTTKKADDTTKKADDTTKKADDDDNKSAATGDMIAVVQQLWLLLSAQLSLLRRLT